jgi:hypothetical protein
MSAARRPRTNYDRVAEVSATPARTGRTAIRTKPVRVTLDLTPALHKDLKRWCNSAAVEMDVSDVTLVALLRALSAELLESDALTKRVRRRLVDQAQQDTAQ